MSVSSGGVTPQEPEITEEMIEAGYLAWCNSSTSGARGTVREILAAALAGRTVVEADALAELRERLAEWDRRRGRVDTGALPFTAVTVIEAARRLASESP